MPYVGINLEDACHKKLVELSKETDFTMTEIITMSIESLHHHTPWPKNDHSDWLKKLGSELKRANKTLRGWCEFNEITQSLIYYIHSNTKDNNYPWQYQKSYNRAHEIRRVIALIEEVVGHEI